MCMLRMWINEDGMRVSMTMNQGKERVQMEKFRDEGVLNWEVLCSGNFLNHT